MYKRIYGIINTQSLNIETFTYSLNCFTSKEFISPFFHLSHSYKLIVTGTIIIINIIIKTTITTLQSIEFVKIKF